MKKLIIIGLMLVMAFPVIGDSQEIPESIGAYDERALLREAIDATIADSIDTYISVTMDKLCKLYL